jgi:hypothetical protein
MIFGLINCFQVKFLNIKLNLFKLLYQMNTILGHYLINYFMIYFIELYLYLIYHFKWLYYLILTIIYSINPIKVIERVGDFGV